MPIFAALYEKVMSWSRHPHALWYLSAVSFAESSFFPVPPDFMLAPMAIAQPKRAFEFAAWTTITSILGAMLGYAIGALFFHMVHPLIIHFGYEPAYLTAVNWFNTWGFLAIFLVNFTPFPYKIFTITAGALGMAFFPFILASLLGRGIRFFIVAALMRLGGEKLELFLLKYSDRLLWSFVFCLVAIYAAWRYFWV